MTKRALLGMLTPSSNTIVEPYTSAILSALLPQVTAHFQRFNVMEIGLSESAIKQFDEAPMLQAATVLNAARMDVIAWNGTSAGWLGFDKDIALCRSITESTGVAATTSVLALNELLAMTGANEIGLVTPYLDEVQRAIMANYRDSGIKVIAEEHLNDHGNFSFSEYGEEAVEEMVYRVAEAKPQAITIFCTNMRGAPLADRLEKALGIPIYDTVSVTVWKALRMVGIDTTRILGWGRLFAVQ